MATARVMNWERGVQGRVGVGQCYPASGVRKLRSHVLVLFIQHVWVLRHDGLEEGTKMSTTCNK